MIRGSAIESQADPRDRIVGAALPQSDSRPVAATRCSNPDELAARLLGSGTNGMAAHLGLSVRTLHRRLAEGGVTARSLVRRLRREHALRLLASGAGLAAAAAAIGLSGPDSFSRFCRREFGRTAGALRAELTRGEGPPRIRGEKRGTRCQ